MLMMGPNYAHLRSLSICERLFRLEQPSLIRDMTLRESLSIYKLSKLLAKARSIPAQSSA